MFTPEEACYLIQTIKSGIILGNPNSIQSKTMKVFRDNGGEPLSIDNLVEQLKNIPDIDLGEAFKHNEGLLNSTLEKLENYCSNNSINCEKLKEDAMRDAIERIEKSK